MSGTTSSQRFPLHEAMAVFERVAGELHSQPSPRDLAVVLARGSSGADAELWGDVAWGALPKSHQTVAFLAHAALSDADILVATGPSPGDVAFRVAAVAARIGGVTDSLGDLAEPLRLEELGRQLAAVLGLPIEGENPATSRFLLESMDSVAADLEAKKGEFDAAHRQAVAMVDAKHRPARPYGE